MTRRLKVVLSVLSILVLVGLTLFLALRPQPQCGVGTVYYSGTGKCYNMPVENYCAILGVGTLTQVGYETNVSADQLGSGTWHNIGDLTGADGNGHVYVPLQGSPDMKAIRISAWLPTKQRYLAENYQQPTANAKIYCWLGDQRIDLTPHPVTGYSRGVEMVGAVAGTIPHPIRTN